MPMCTAAQIVTAIAIAAVSLTIGYRLGARQAVPASPPPVSTPPASSKNTNAEIPSEVESDDGDDELADGDLSSITAGFMEACKLVLVVRTDLGMTPGKIAAQHATLACHKALVKKNPKLVAHWERTGQAKIALKATSEDQILELEAIAKSLNLCARSIQDAGRTQVEPGSRTVLGIGPGFMHHVVAPVDLVNRVTGKLRLL